jgi:hypothetical protein
MMDIDDIRIRPSDSFVGVNDILYAKGVLTTFAKSMTPAGSLGGCVLLGGGEPLSLLSPEHSRIIGREMTRTQAQQFLYDTATLPTTELSPEVRDFLHQLPAGIMGGRDALRVAEQPEHIMMVDDNSGSRSAKELLNTFARSVAYVGNRNINGEGEPLIIMCPTHARLLSNGGYSKTDVKRFFWERARVPFGHIPAGNLQSYSERFLKFYGDFGPDYGVPFADRPEDIVIAVMGGQGTHSLSVQTLMGSKSQTVPICPKDGSSMG